MKEKFREITNASLILSANRALWHEIRPNMRRVTVDYDEKNKLVTLHLFYDKPLDQEELDNDVPGCILAEMISDFPSAISWKDEVIILPYPKRIPNTGLCVFQRYEPAPMV